MSNLFQQVGDGTWSEPLAYALRPVNLDEFFGQDHIVGDGKLLKSLISDDKIHSMIFYGPPGTGKTTLAKIIANETSADFEQVSAVTGGVAELRKVIGRARNSKEMGRRTVLFVDEIHRFSKSQQDALLPATEDGSVILIGATTENPSFEVNSALLSRAQVFVFKSLGEDALRGILDRAVSVVSKRMKKDFDIDDEGRDLLVAYANGDARSLLNSLEIVLKVVSDETVSVSAIKGVMQKRGLRYDKKGEEHFNIISALHKSLRDSDPDAAIYWMTRMLEAGEDPLYIARRLVRFASEDVGMADPNALSVCVAAQQACHFLGMPECNVNLAQAVVYLSMAPKSNALYKACSSAVSDVRNLGNLDVPLHLRNAPTKLMKGLGYGSGYKYAHDFDGAVVSQRHLPDELVGRVYYEPVDRGIEARIKVKLDELRGGNLS